MNSEEYIANMAEQHRLRQKRLKEAGHPSTTPPGYRDRHEQEARKKELKSMLDGLPPLSDDYDADEDLQITDKMLLIFGGITIMLGISIAFVLMGGAV